MKPSFEISDPLPLDRMGQLFASHIRQQPLAHDVAERLRIARHQAVARAYQLGADRVALTPPQMARIPELATAGFSLKKLGGRMWLGLGSAIPLLALVVGLVMLSGFHSQKWLNEVSRIDSALLADDLPPDAFTDSGFLTFLNAEKRAETISEGESDATASETTDKPGETANK